MATTPTRTPPTTLQTARITPDTIRARSTTIQPKPKPKPEPTALERTQTALDSLEATDREKRRQIKSLQWEVNEELGPKIAAARAERDAARSQVAADERNAIATARQAPEVARQELARRLTWKLGDPVL